MTKNFDGVSNIFFSAAVTNKTIFYDRNSQMYIFQKLLFSNYLVFFLLHAEIIALIAITTINYLLKLLWSVFSLKI